MIQAMVCTAAGALAFAGFITGLATDGDRGSTFSVDGSLLFGQETVRGAGASAETFTERTSGVEATH